MKINLKNYILPVLIGAGALISAITDQKREEKIDQLMKEIKKLESKEEES